MLEASDRLDKTCREAPGMFCVLALGAVDDGAEVDVPVTSRWRPEERLTKRAISNPAGEMSRNAAIASRAIASA